MSDTTQNGLARTPVLTIATLSVASIFVWFDVFLHLVLAGPIAAHFLTGSNPGAASAFALLTFAAGFVMRPLGALLFGAMGTLMQGIQPLFHQGKWQFSAVLSGIAVLLYLAAEYAIINFVRGNPALTRATVMQMFATSLVTMLLSPLVFWLLFRIAKACNHSINPEAGRRRRQREY